MIMLILIGLEIVNGKKLVKIQKEDIVVKQKKLVDLVMVNVF